MALCRYLPHRAGIFDVLSLAASTLEDQRRLERVEEALLGHDWAYSVELTDSPASSGISLLGGLPEVWNLRVVTKDFKDYQFLHFLTKVNVRHQLEVVPCGAAEAEIGKHDWLQQRWCLRHEGPGYATLALEATAQLYVEEAESAIPALKVANVKQVLLIAVVERKEDRDRLDRVQAVLKKALPQAKIEPIVFDGEQHAKMLRTRGQGNSEKITTFVVQDAARTPAANR